MSKAHQDVLVEAAAAIAYLNGVKAGQGRAPTNEDILLFEIHEALEAIKEALA